MRGWLLEAYKQLVEKRPLTTEELRSTPFTLDWETIAKIFYIQKTYFGLGDPFPRKRSHHVATRPDRDLSVMVMELFSTELGAMEDTGHTKLVPDRAQLYDCGGDTPPLLPIW